MYYIKPRTRKVIFDGNSLFNYGSGNLSNNYAIPTLVYESLTGARPAAQFYGVSARRVQQLIDEFPTKIAPFMQNGDILIMNEQTNSLKDLLNASTVHTQLLAYFSQVKSYFPDSPTIYVNMIARDSAGDPPMEALRLELNALTISMINVNSVIDVGGLSFFNSVAACSNLTYYNADELHLATQGNVEYAAPITTTLQTYL